MIKLAVYVFVLFLLLLGPLALIWALNVLFVQVTITYDIVSYVAALILMFALGGYRLTFKQ